MGNSLVNYLYNKCYYDAENKLNKLKNKPVKKQKQELLYRLSFDGRNSVYHIIEDRQYILMKSLLDFNFIGKDNISKILKVACINNKTELALNALQYNCCRSSAFIDACKNKMSKVIFEMLKDTIGEIEYNFYENDTHYTALLFLCGNKMTDEALELLKVGKKCIPMYVAKNGKTALIIACHHNMTPVICEILKYQCSPEKVTTGGDTALLWTCYNNNPECALKIVDLNCSPGQIDINNKTAMIYACIYKMKAVVRKLIKKNYKPGHLDKNKNHALILVCKNNWQDIGIEIFEKCKTTYNIKNNDGITAMYYINKFKMIELNNMICDFIETNEKISRIVNASSVTKVEIPVNS